MKIDPPLILGSRLTAGAIGLIAALALGNLIITGPLTTALAWTAGGLALVTFLRLVLDRQTREKIDAINARGAAYAAEQPRGVKLHDPQWGLFGAEYGSLPGRIVVVSLFGEGLIAQWSLGTSHPLTMMIAGALFAAMTSTMLEMTGNADDVARD